MATNKEPALRRKTPLLICSSRTAIPYPRMGSSASVFRMSMSRVPSDEITRLVCHRRIPPEVQEEEYASPTDCQEEKRAKGRTGGRFRTYGHCKGEMVASFGACKGRTT